MSPVSTSDPMARLSTSDSTAKLSSDSKSSSTNTTTTTTTKVSSNNHDPISSSLSNSNTELLCHNNDINPWNINVASDISWCRATLVRVVAFAFYFFTPIFVKLIHSLNSLWQQMKPITKHPTYGPIINPILDVIADLVTNYRGFFVTVIINPICLLWDIIDSIRDWMLDQCMPKIGNVTLRKSIHQQRIHYVQQQILSLVKNGATRLCTARPGYLAMSVRAAKYKSKWSGVDISSLRDVIEIDLNRHVVLVEPSCTMGRLTRELLSQGWIIQVVPELDDLTVGGLINGFGIETSSHKYGLFQHTCTAFEIVLPTGEFIRCDTNNHPDLFAAIPWSHGTIGFLVGAEIKLIRAPPYVRLQYLPCLSAKDASHTFEQACRDNDHDFVEALQFSRTTSVVMTGNLVSHVPPGETLNKLGKWYKPWFFTHVRSYLGKSPKDNNHGLIEYIPLRDYYHRHTKSIFWEMQDIIPKANTLWYRWLFSWAGPPKVSLLKLSSTGKIHEHWVTKHVVQDLLVPMITLDAALDFFHHELNLYPLWLCPMRMLSPSEDLLALRKDPGTILRQALNEHGGRKVQIDQPVTTPTGSFVPPHPFDQLYVDIGAYGIPKTPNFHHVRTLEQIEEFIRSVQGYSACYADIVGTRNQFRTMFDHRNLDQVRRKYGAIDLLPEVYEKVHKSARD